MILRQILMALRAGATRAQRELVLSAYVHFPARRRRLPEVTPCR